jgi:hypothetical protein
MGSVIWMKQVRLLSSTWSKVMARHTDPTSCPLSQLSVRADLALVIPTTHLGCSSVVERSGDTERSLVRIQSSGRCLIILPALILFALVAELVDARVSRTRAFGHAGSSPALGTIVL